MKANTIGAAFSREEKLLEFKEAKLLCHAWPEISMLCFSISLRFH